jgi:hypothetical protein
MLVCISACLLAGLQYALDYYPPFASGCGFVLSRDLVEALLQQPLPDYALLVRCPTSGCSGCPACIEIVCMQLHFPA